MNKVINLLIVLCLTSGMTLAQNRTIVQMEVVDNPEETSSRNNYISLKINPTLLMRGDMPFYIEVPLTENLAIEGGVGVTVRDYWGEIVDENYAFLVDDLNSVTYSTGTSARLGLKYYTSSYGFQQEGYFFGVEYRYQNYKATINSSGSFTSLDEPLKRQYNDIRFLMGYKEYLDDNVFLEGYVGFGLRDRSVDIPFSESVQAISGFGLAREDKTVLLISGGIKLGVTF